VFFKRSFKKKKGKGRREKVGLERTSVDSPSLPSALIDMAVAGTMHSGSPS